MGLWPVAAGYPKRAAHDVSRLWPWPIPPLLDAVLSSLPARPCRAAESPASAAILKGGVGAHRITVPVTLPSGLHTMIEDVEARSFAGKHWASISQAYARAPHFNQEEASFKVHDAAQHRWLSEVNVMPLREIAAKLGFKTKIVRSTWLGIAGDKTGVDICRHFGATSYLSGPAAQSYLQTDRFADAGIAVEWTDYWLS
jgi:hypothetical protein